MYIRSIKKRANEVSIQEPIGTDKEGNDIALEDVLPAENDSIIDQIDAKVQTKKLYHKMKHTLIGRELKVIEMRYGLASGKEQTQREIAQLLDISRSYVSRLAYCKRGWSFKRITSTKKEDKPCICKACPLFGFLVILRG